MSFESKPVRPLSNCNLAYCSSLRKGLLAAKAEKEDGPYFRNRIVIG